MSTENNKHDSEESAENVISIEDKQKSCKHETVIADRCIACKKKME